MDQESKTVFISYRRGMGSYIARAVYQHLREQGYDVFMDVESIDSGTFDTIILNQIAARAHFVLILTPDTVEGLERPKDWLRREIERAVELDRNIVPILADGFTFESVQSHLTGKLGELSRYSGLTVHHDYFEEAMERLRTRFLKKPVYATVMPTPDGERTAVQRKIARADRESAPIRKTRRLWVWVVGVALALVVLGGSFAGLRAALRSQTPSIETSQITSTAALTPTRVPTRVTVLTPTHTPWSAATHTPIPTSTPTRLPTSTPTRLPTVTRTKAPEKEVTRTVTEALYSHSFDYDDGNWSLVEPERTNKWGTVKTTLTGGKYRFEYTASLTSVYRMCLRDRDFSNFALSVEATIVEDPGYFSYGVVFRRIEGEYKYYDLRLNSRSEYTVEMRDDDYTELVDWTESPAINNKGTNRIDITAVDSTLSFAVNDQHLATVTDDTWRTGRVCFLMWVADGESATVDFDNLRIYSAR